MGFGIWGVLGLGVRICNPTESLEELLEDTEKRQQELSEKQHRGGNPGLGGRVLYAFGA